MNPNWLTRFFDFTPSRWSTGLNHRWPFAVNLTSSAIPLLAEYGCIHAKRAFMILLIYHLLLQRSPNLVIIFKYIRQFNKDKLDNGQREGIMF